MKVTIKEKELEKLLAKIRKRHRKLLKAEAFHNEKKVLKHDVKMLHLMLELNKLKHSA